ncbi:MAG: hypothetical protein Q8K00_20710 [Syntrophales bacterium]|nr:hypothetical protein [Syntrophales bacterium]
MITSAWEVFRSFPMAGSSKDGCKEPSDKSSLGYQMKPFAEDVWVELCPYLATRPPLTELFIWDEERRFMIRCEIDALFFHLYGIYQGNDDYILETFPIVKNKDITQYGEYHTKNLILEIYDAFQQAMESGWLYQTILDAPLADFIVGHSLWERNGE